MEERPTYVYIPPNISGGGTVLNGMLSIRNVIEGAIVFACFIVLRIISNALFPWPFIGWILLAIGFIFFVVCAMGVGGEPFSVFILNVINFENRRVFVTLRPPMPEKKKAAERKESRFERYLKDKMGLEEEPK